MKVLAWLVRPRSFDFERKGIFVWGSYAMDVWGLGVTVHVRTCRCFDASLTVGPLQVFCDLDRWHKG